MTIRKTWRLSRWSFYCALVLIVGAALCHASYARDGRHLRTVALEATQHAQTDSQRVLTLLDYVHGISKTAENRRFFLLPWLRATPLQVLQKGGDCADKSRLLAALLHGIDIDATMILCFDEQTGAPTHTVVSAITQDAGNMVVDPAYGIAFPKVHSGYYGLVDLREDSTILGHRLDDLRTSLPSRHPVHAYQPSRASYHQAASFNWRKNTGTRLMHHCLHRLFGDSLYLWSRPVLLEEPKLSVSFLALLAAVAFLVLPTIAGRFGRACTWALWIRRPRRTEGVTANSVAAVI